ncbi:MAG: 50S ribosomal protein L15 [Candidatus Eisenbacteria bacterium]|nr:50S ribosomal protein L15 [Candidatus Eisenbacteria bacterium]
MELHNLRPEKGAVRPRKRIGRGPGSGTGKTSGKGHKGQNARSGGGVQPWFEGGQMPLQRRVPKRGFKNPFRKTYQIVNIQDLARCEGADRIDPDVMAENGLIRNPVAPVKLLGNGEVSGAYQVTVHAASAQAIQKIEAAGGRVTVAK